MLLKAIWAVLLPLLLGMGSAVLAFVVRWPREFFQARLAHLEHISGFYPGTDLTMLIGRGASLLPGFTPIEALAAASVAAFPALFFLVAATLDGKPGQWRAASLAVSNPLTIAAVVAGLGWSVVGFYGLWRLFAILPRTAPHQGMPLAGIGIGVAYVTVPQFGSYLLPVGALLFLCAPAAMLSRHMRVFYLLSFAPVTMIAGSYAYSAALFDTPVTSHAPSAAVLSLGMVVIGMIIAAPGLVRLAHPGRIAPRLAVIGVTVLTATGGAAWGFTLMLSAALGQRAIADTEGEGESALWTGLSIFGSSVIMVLFDRMPAL